MLSDVCSKAEGNSVETGLPSDTETFVHSVSKGWQFGDLSVL